jgi:hypothetical protein
MVRVLTLTTCNNALVRACAWTWRARAARLAIDCARCISCVAGGGTEVVSLFLQQNVTLPYTKVPLQHFVYSFNDLFLPVAAWAGKTGEAKYHPLVHALLELLC